MLNCFSVFAQTTQASPQFMQAMDQQLTSEFRQLTQGVDIHRFALTPTSVIERSFTIKFLEGVSILACNLSAPAGPAYSISIGWQSIPTGRQIFPQDDIQAGEIRFEWQQLPAQQIFKQFGYPLPLPFDTTPFPFIIEYWEAPLPDVHLYIEFTEAPPSKTEEILYKVLDQELATWGELNEDLLENNQPHAGFIHSLGEVEHVNRQHFCFRVDLGSALFHGLQKILQILSHASIAPLICKVKVS
ncbi:hypothetical protein [uncultured Microscilla sp.]|uniref:hypothetical protein n=1 Tax=uncultured Microscilla sp. TaxID=432653 RepID=UPI00260FDE52|nr:hypothetical protein [uncultured Microscilla sp.]